MKIQYVLLFLIFSLSAEAAAQHFNYNRDYQSILKRSMMAGDSLNYDSLLPRFNRCDTSLTDYQVLALMIGYTGKPAYKPYRYRTTEEQIFLLNTEGRYRQAIAVYDTFIAGHPLSQYAHTEASFAYSKLGKTDSATISAYKAFTIMRAMAHSGNGKTGDNAIFALEPIDGQNYIQKFLRGKIGMMGIGRDHRGNICDVLQLRYTDQGQQKTEALYFVIQHAINTSGPKPKR